MTYGTLGVFDTLAASGASVASFGEDKAWDAIGAALAAHNATVAEMTGLLAESSTDRQRRYGSAASMVMDEFDEFGRAEAQKATVGVTVGFPLRLYGAALQWTRKYFENATTQELAGQISALQDADINAVLREIKKAVFLPTNYTYADHLVDNVDLAVKALVNADSAAIPPGPNGETFTASTHTHYNYTAGTSLAAVDLTALIEDVVEHHNRGDARVYVNRAQEAAVRGLTGFTAYLDARIIPGSATTSATANLDPSNLYNRAIGIFGGAEIWVKPWIPAGYLFCTVVGAPKPLVLRRRDRAGAGNLELDFDDEQHPLRAKGYGREFGVGVWTRTNGAVLFVDAGAAGAYVAPTVV